ncbi:hypothetical protein M3194_30420 [Paenibacillus glycanilyticus]|uniref:hypothetical protein n=1 Tax=Paenibacillus glycanilyticus TaxID=126569 RepID=UPI002041BF8D|nr:hypothetical protein [Paenibacillus glycanilyticus]MCM3631614.1 hypothetical protein [Paenibacillus glycanilyticus]
MRIVQISTNTIPVPPKNYGGKVRNRKRLPSARRLRRYARTRYSGQNMTDAFMKLYRRVINKKLYKFKQNTLWNRREAKLQSSSNGEEY